MNTSRFGIAFALALGAVPITSHAQVAVFDAAGEVQWIQEVTLLTGELTTVKDTYSSLTGTTGIGNLLPTATSTLKTNLPSNSSTVYPDSLNSGSSSYSARSTQIVTTVKSKIDGMGRGDALTYANSQLDSKGATDRAVNEKTYDNDMAEMDNIQSLNEQINSATTSKEVGDLQARIATARGSTEAEQAKLSQVQALAKSEDQILALQKAEAVRRYTIGTSSDTNTAPNLTP